MNFFQKSNIVFKIIGAHKKYGILNILYLVIYEIFFIISKKSKLTDYLIKNNKYSEESEPYLPSPFLILSLTKKYIPKNINYSFFDFGCGKGRVLRYYENNYFIDKLYGIESNPDIIENITFSDKIKIYIDDCNNEILISRLVKIKTNKIIFFYYPFSHKLILEIINKFLSANNKKIIVIVVALNHLMNDDLSGLTLIKKNSFFKIYTS